MDVASSQTMPGRLAIQVQPPPTAMLETYAQGLAAELGLPMLGTADAQRREPGPVLMVTSERLELRRTLSDRGVSMDLAKLDTHSGPGRSLQNPLLKAVGIGKGNPYRPTVLDTTVGYGEDAWLLAAMGCPVTGLERHPAVFALLRDALKRAEKFDAQTAGRVRVELGDSAPWIGESSGWDVVYLDPMFPAGRKTTERKPMRVMRQLVGEDADASRLLRSALEGARAGAGAGAADRVVVKRPRRGPALDGPAPVTSHAGKALRFDVYKPTLR